MSEDGELLRGRKAVKDLDGSAGGEPYQPALRERTHSCVFT